MNVSGNADMCRQYSLSQSKMHGVSEGLESAKGKQQ
jgi:hypothetical protein